MGRKKKTYTLEFKRKCITELLNGKEFAKVCADNSVAPSTLSDWKNSVIEGIGSSRKSKEEARMLDEAEKELARAQIMIGKNEMESELLKKKPGCSELERF